MSYTNHTTNLELPQYIGTDKPTYLGDFNTAMQNIDTGYASNKTLAETANTNASSALSTATSASSDATSAISTANSASTLAGQADVKADTALNTSASANTKADTAISNASTNATNIGTLANLTTTSKTNLVNAINEIDARKNYSSTETLIGEFLGKPLYRKVFVIPKSQTTSSSIDLTHGISNIDHFTNIYGVIKRTDNITDIIPVVNLANQGFLLRFGDIDNTYIKLRMGADIYNVMDTIYLVAEYCKTNS